MTNRNRAELEKKLSLGDVPPPPDDLAARIKQEIPEHFMLRPEAERFAARHAASRRAVWQIAAMLLVVLGVGYVSFMTMTARRKEVASEVANAVTTATVATAPQQAPVIETDAAMSDAPAPRPVTNAPPTETKGYAEAQSRGESSNFARRILVEDSSAPTVAAAPPPPAEPVAEIAAEPFRAAAPPPSVAAAAPQKVLGGIEGGVVGGVAGGVTTQREEVTVRAKRLQSSTGGTEEPNNQAYGDVFFQDYGTNPFIDTEDDRLSTFGLEVDTASYTVVRRYLRENHLPPSAAVRVEEMINYFDYGDAAPRSGDFAVNAEGGPSPFPRGPRYQMLRFGIKAREVRAAARKPANLVFLVDVSGSMARENRLGLVKRALGYLVDELRSDDEVGIVVFNAQAMRVLEPTSDESSIREALAQLEASGSTNVGKGLILAYEMAWENYKKNGINRIILCSDGVANVGATDAESILERVGRYARMGVELTTVGVGMGNFNDVLLEQMADKGDGRYAYVDTLEEARRVFVENLTGTLQTVAKDAKVQVEFNPRVVSRYRLIGYENRDIADARFRDDDVDAGEIGAGHDVTALYEVKLADNAPSAATLATLTLRYQSTETREVEEIEKSIRLADFAKSWENARPSFQLATVVATFGEVLKGSYWSKEISAADVLRKAKALEDDRSGRELVDLIETAAELKGR